MTLTNDSVGRHPIPFAQDDDIATHHLATGNSNTFSITNDQGARAAEISQSFEHAFGPAFLHNGNEDRYGCEDEKNNGFMKISENEVDHTPSEQQHKHGLAQYFENDAQRCSPFC